MALSDMIFYLAIQGPYPHTGGRIGLGSVRESVLQPASSSADPE